MDEVLNYLPNLNKVKINSESGDHHFTLIRLDEKNWTFQVTQSARDFDNELRNAYMASEKERIEKEREARLTQMLQLSERGSNPSNEFLDVDYTTMAGQIIEKIYYGLFDEVNSYAFNETLSLYLLVVSKYGKFYSNDIEFLERELRQVEHYNGIAKTNTRDIKINVESRFKYALLNHLRADHFSGWKAFMVADIETILGAYATDSKVFFQLNENMYRCLNKMSPISSIK